MEFSFENKNSDSSVASSRLKKAIERNRTRQAKRDSRPVSDLSAPPKKPMGLAARLRATTSSKKTSPGLPLGSERPFGRTASAGPRPTTRTSRGVRPLGSTPTAATASSGIRKSVARADDFEFAGEIAPRANKSLRSANYSSPTTAKRKVKARSKAKPKNSSYLDFLIKGCWIFGAFLLLRLVFAEGGVLDFYYANEVLIEKNSELAESKVENIDLQAEIEKIRKNVRYQKKLVRDHLGYISKDEYLVLFSKNSSKSL